MNDELVRVTQFELDAEASFETRAKITVTRRSAISPSLGGGFPRSSDVPPDIRQALLDWLQSDQVVDK